MPEVLSVGVRPADAPITEDDGFLAAALEHASIPTLMMSLIHVTGDGLLNLSRVRAPVGFDLTTLPEPPPIFRMIQRRGGVATAEMMRVFNMGVGFCVLIPDEARALAAVRETAARHGIQSWVLGRTVADDRRRVWLRTLALVGEGEAFVEEAGVGAR